MAYEALIVVAIAFLAALVFVLAYAAVTGRVGPLRVTGAARAALQICVLAAIGAYFTSFWRKGQTLPMKTWRLRLVDTDGGPVTTMRALARFGLAAAAYIPALIGGIELRFHPQAPLGWLGIAPAVIALGWCLFDGERRALYDWLSGTRLVRTDNPTSAGAHSR